MRRWLPLLSLPLLLACSNKLGSEGTEPGASDADGDGWTVDDGDCDDDDPDVHPGADELCNGIDDDCDGALLPGEDSDGDGDGVLDCDDDCPVQVDATAVAGGDGTPVRPLATVGEGLDAAVDLACDEVQVHPGTYTETLDFGGADLRLSSTDGPELTVLDGGGDGPVVTFASGESSAAALEGFTVTGGRAERGAGIHVDGADPRITGNIVVANATTTGGLGGGLYLYDSESRVTGNTIEGNDACLGGPDHGCDGGGLAILYGAPLVQHNLVLDNTAGDGGGIWVAHGEAEILNNVIHGNAADDQGRQDEAGYTLRGQGGGVDFQADTAGVLLAANIVTSNEASTHGGGIAMIGYYVDTDVAEPTVVNNTVAFNSVGEGGYGAGVVIWGLSAPEVVNNAVCSNHGQGLYAQYANATIAYNDAWGNDTDWAGAPGDLAGTDGNLSQDPQFASATDDGDHADDDFGVGAGSPLVDAGDPGITDVDGSRSDVGAYGGPHGGW